MATYDSISTKKYVEVLKSLPEEYREVLVAQFQCPRHEVSAGQLARLIGYKRHSNGNYFYGHTAHLICNFLKIAKPQPVNQWFAALSTWYQYWYPHRKPVWIWAMRPNLVEAIKQLGWSREQQYQTFFASSDEQATSEEFAEGWVQLVAVNIFERSAKARSVCLRHYGYVCSVCGFDFEKFYGELGREFAHVHHLKSLAEIGKEYMVDPIRDLRPVCPNCHAMLHQKTQALTIDELKKLIRNSNR